jgi:hypothetical protein
MERRRRPPLCLPLSCGEERLPKAPPGLLRRDGDGIEPGPAAAGAKQENEIADDDITNGRHEDRGGRAADQPAERSRGNAVARKHGVLDRGQCVHVGCAGRSDIGSHETERLPRETKRRGRTCDLPQARHPRQPGAIAPRFGLICDGIQEPRDGFPTARANRISEVEVRGLPRIMTLPWSGPSRQPMPAPAASCRQALLATSASRSFGSVPTTAQA